MPAGPQAGLSRNRRRRILPIRTSVTLASVAVLGGTLAISTVSLAASSGKAARDAAAAPAIAPASDYRVLARTATPIKHIVVMFDENVSFDHYFGTYPNAANTDGLAVPRRPGTPTVNGLTPSC